MKVNKYCEATTEDTPLNEIQEMISTYELSRLLEKIIENEPTKTLSVKISIELLY